MKRMRDELTELRQEEIELEQKVGASHSQVAQLDKRLVDTQSQISQVLARLYWLSFLQHSFTICASCFIYKNSPNIKPHLCIHLTVHFYRQDLPEGQLCRYFVYSRADFRVFPPAGATHSTDQGEIWHGGVDAPPCQISPW